MSTASTTRPSPKASKAQSSAEAPPAEGAAPAHPFPRQGEPGSRDELFAGSVLEALRRVQGRICGEGAVEQPGLAEGLALSGQRAALLPSPHEVDLLRIHAPDVAWVAHRIEPSQGLWADTKVIEWRARGAQEAVDLACAGHLLAERMRAPVVCTIPEALATSLHLLRLPSAAAIHALLGSTPRPAGAARPSLGEALAELRQAFEAALLRPLEEAQILEGMETDHAHLETPSAATRAGGSQQGSGAKAIGVVPASPEAARLLLDAVSYLGLLEGVSIESLARTDLATCLHLVEGAPSAAEAAAPASSEAAGRPLDLLLIPHQEWITPRTVQTLRLGGTLLAPARAAEGARLSPAQRRLLQRRQITLRWIALEALHEPLDSGTLHGALLESGGWLPRLERCGALSSAEISESAERALRRGAAALRDAVPEASMPEEPSLLTGPSLPRMPRPAATAPSASNLMAARRFHLVGAERLEARLDEPLFPLLATDAEGIEEPAYPLLLGGMEALPQPGTARSLRAALEAALEQSGEAFPIVREHLPRLVERAAELASHRPEGVRAAEAFETLWEGLLAEIDASPAAREAIEAELGRAKRLLDLQGYLLSPGPELPLRLALDTLRKRHRRLLEPFLAELATASVRLAEMLRLDSAHDGAQVSADSLSASLGGAADRFFDPGALRRTLPAYRGSTPLGAARRARLEATQATLDAFLDARAFATEVVLVCEDAAPSGLDPEAVRVVVHPDGPAVAVGLFDGLAASFVGVLRALRIARLELEGAYDPALHDEALARFGWRSFEPHEVQLLPRIVVLASAAHLRGPGLGSLSALLRSGRPLQMLVPLADPSEAGALGGAPAELGYLAIAHRDALVVQTTLARPGHLIRGLDRMAETLRPAVAFIGSASWSGIDPGRLAALRHASRETPCFIHDPDGGSSWAERFEFDENPAPERLWLEREIPLLDADGETQSLRAELTSAHADALDPRLRRHFELLRPEQWSAEQIPLADYIREIGEHPPPRVPYLWALDAEGELRRAILTRQLAYACRDRARIWGILQELGGTNDEYARRAVDAAEARADEAAAAALAEREHEFEAELERTRADAAGEAMDRLVGVLLNLDSAPAPAALFRPSSAEPAAPEPGAGSAQALAAAGAEESASAEPVPAAAALSFDEPYVESILCTTCNECTNLNELLFKYNDERQAYIADPAAGTFLQLVTAAEKCPAHCIHTGAPRAGDPTVTPQLLERAAKHR